MVVLAGLTSAKRSFDRQIAACNTSIVLGLFCNFRQQFLNLIAHMHFSWRCLLAWRFRVADERYSCHLYVGICVTARCCSRVNGIRRSPSNSLVLKLCCLVQKFVLAAQNHCALCLFPQLCFDTQAIDGRQQLYNTQHTSYLPDNHIRCRWFEVFCRHWCCATVGLQHTALPVSKVRTQQQETQRHV